MQTDLIDPPCDPKFEHAEEDARDVAERINAAIEGGRLPVFDIAAEAYWHERYEEFRVRLVCTAWEREVIYDDDPLDAPRCWSHALGDWLHKQSRELRGES